MGFNDSETLEISVLYVEDEEQIRTSLAKILRRKVATVHEAANGREGLELFKEHNPDIVITDIKMPKMDGIKLSREIKNISPYTPIVVMTAFTDVDHFMDAIEIGVERFILKPIDTKGLYSLISQSAEKITAKRALAENITLLNEYKKAVDVSSIVAKTDHAGLITYVNDAFCEISGYSNEELLGSDIKMLRHPNTQQQKLDEMEAAIKEGQIWKGVFENLKKDGSSFFVDSTVVPMLDSEGGIIDFIIISRDITSQVLQQRELEAMRFEQMKDGIDRAIDMKLETVIQLTPLPGIIVDEQDYMVNHNSAFASLFDMIEDKQKLEELKERKRTVSSLFVDEEGFLSSREDAIDWKDFVRGVDDENISRTKLAISQERNIFKTQVFGSPFSDSSNSRYLVYFTTVC